jgi:F-type H+-transporting ATPase subunit delta
MKKGAADRIYAAALYEAVQGDVETDALIRNFLRFLKEKKKLHRIEKIIKEFEKIYNERKGIFSLKIASARKLDKEIVEKIAGALKIEKYELTPEIDKKLLGGFVAQYGDSLFDMSIKNNLEKLSKQLKS